ncbi:MAG: BamA/TamA family outer membrane protein [Gammaproteobacteria bacterium]|nr:BamA/TamA family outer membrane protein [Gammaproteobacteria bacterium]
MSNTPGKALVLAICMSLATGAVAEDEGSLWDEFTDKEDGKVDVSDWLGQKYGFLPTPILITGPTFGSGLGLNLLFLHGSLANESASSGRYIPPSISGAAFAATENDSRFGAAYHIGFYRDDTIRTTTFVGHPDANLDFYPDVPIIGEQNISMNLEGWAGYQEVKFRLGDSRFFVGGNYLYFSSTSSPNDTPSFLPDDLLEQDIDVAALSAVVDYDSRDSIFTPNSGTYAKLVASRYDEAVGSDFDFWSYRAKLFNFTPVGESFNLGLRTEAQSVDGTAPYFAYPSVDLRGIPLARYQGEHTFVVEAEGRWALDNRWSLIGFAGSGKAFGDDKLNRDQSFSEADWNNAWGLGFRYKIARKFGMQLGIDYAVGPEDESFYITVGQAWNAFF